MTFDQAKRLALPHALTTIMLLGMHSGLAAADCIDPTDPSLDGVRRGQINPFPGTSPVVWRAAQMSTGLDQAQVSVDVAWVDQGGQRRHQTLLMGQKADQIPTVTHDGPVLIVHLHYCDFAGPCRAGNVPYAWDRAARRFIATTTVGRRGMAEAEACEDGQE